MGAEERGVALSDKLIQEDLIESGGPNVEWKMLVACILLNRATAKVARPIFDRILQRWPTPEAMADATCPELGKELKRLGLQYTRAIRLTAMSHGYLAGIPIHRLPGVGPYAMESHRIFIRGETDFVPTDAKLRGYLSRQRG